MNHVSGGRPFRGSIDANEWTEAEAYELLEVDERQQDVPEAQGLLSEDVEAKLSMDDAETPSKRPEVDEFSMDEMVARVSLRSIRILAMLGMPLTRVQKDGTVYR